MRSGETVRGNEQTVDTERTKEKEQKSYRELVTEEYYIEAMKIGIKPKDYFKMTLHDISLCFIAYREKEKESVQMIGYNAWVNGIYTRNAILSTIGNSSWFKAQGTEPFKYPDNPLLQEDSNRPLTEEEIIEKTKAIFGQLDMIGKNFNRTHKKGE